MHRKERRFDRIICYFIKETYLDFKLGLNVGSLIQFINYCIRSIDLVFFKTASKGRLPIKINEKFPRLYLKSLLILTHN